MDSKNEKLNIELIKEPLKKYLQTDDPEDFFAMIINIYERMTADGTVPSPMKTEPRIVVGIDPDLEIEDVLPSDKGPLQRSGLIEEEDGNKWIPLFTDSSELGKLSKTTVLVERPIREIVTEAFENENLSGMVINPYSDALSLRKEIIYVILQLDDDGLEGAEAGSQDE